MSLIEAVKPKSLKGPVPPREVEDRCRRGREEMLRGASNRRLCQKFEEGDHYWFVNEKGRLLFQDTVTHANGSGKPPHRIRNKYNFLGSMVEGKVSAATQRVPSYEITPSSTEPEDVNAARLAEKVAVYGYDKWSVRRATVKVVKTALVEGEGFAMPYFDPNVGPFLETLNPETNEVEWIGQGEVKIRTFTGNEVYWEPGCDFNESRWFAIEQARPIDEVKETPGFYGGTLKPDANTSDNPSTVDSDQMVLVTEYFERPCPKYREGRKLWIANGKVICPEETYPCRNHQGEVVDEPVLHKLSYIVDPFQDRDRGLVEQLIDLQRTINDCWNKLLEWKNRCLNPQMTAPVGSLVTQPDDVPGAVRYYRPVGGAGAKPEWEQAPPVPRELFSILDTAVSHMRALAADVDVQAEADVAARTAHAAIEQGRQRWQAFLGDLAEWHSRLMRHCLYLVQAHYTEPRLVKIQGTFGADLVPGFMGADLHGQADVRVNPGTLEVRSRRAVTEESVLFADKGWISPQAAMAAIEGGVGSDLGKGWMLDVARANQIIQTIKSGEDALFSMRANPDGTPGWMPRKGIDNIAIHIEVFSSWLKTADWDRLPDPMREAGNLYLQGLFQLQAQEQAEAAAAQAMMAEDRGMANAAKDPGVKQMPDAPAMDGPPAGEQP